MDLKKIFTVFLSVLCLFSVIRLSYGSPRSEVQALVKKYKLENASIGIAASYTDKDKLIYDYAQNRSFTPASNNKIFTAIAALTALPDDFTFDTTVLYNPAQLKNQTLNGDLIIEFSGDPSLTGTELYKLIERIKNKIHDIKGNILIIANTFTGSYIPPGWSGEDVDYCYAAPASTLNMNKNCLVIKLINTEGNKTKVEPVANTGNIIIHNDTRLAYAAARKDCPFIIKMDNKNILTLSGCLPRKAEFYMSLAIANPALKTLDTIKDFFKQVGIHYSGDIKTGTMPTNGHYQTLVEHKSANLKQMITYMLVHSDNLYAESLARTVGFKLSGDGSIENSTKVIESLLEKTYGVNIHALTMKDGSGLSLLDEVSPYFMVTLLNKVYRSKIGKKLYDYLPTSGIDGTLSYRMSKTLRGKVHAKTGTLSGVSTLSGYLVTKRKHIVTFSIMLNELSEKQRYNARAFQDSVLRVFYNYF
ncbi:MAG: D-alanyl-D-alanine carboxypeptidase/D-alanyl-D-alanine endopeptidase [Francisellaceae bacterium]